MDENMTMTVTRIVIVLVVLAVVIGLSWMLLRKRRGDDELELHPRRRGSALDRGAPLPPSELQDFDVQGVELINRTPESAAAQKTSRLSPTFFGGGKKPAKTTSPREQEPTMNLPLTIMARYGKTFSGKDVDKLVRTFGLVRSPHNTFELIDGNAVFFTLLNVHKPGTFPPRLEDIQAIEGMMMIMQLPVGNDAQKSLETFLAMAAEMTEEVNGRLCDFERVPMSDKDLLKYRKAAEQFEEQHQAWRARQR